MERGKQEAKGIERKEKRKEEDMKGTWDETRKEVGT